MSRPVRCPVPSPQSPVPSRLRPRERQSTPARRERLAHALSAIERTHFEAIVLRAGPRINFTIDKHFKYEDLLTCPSCLHGAARGGRETGRAPCLCVALITLMTTCLLCAPPAPGHGSHIVLNCTAMSRITAVALFPSAARHNLQGNSSHTPSLKRVTQRTEVLPVIHIQMENLSPCGPCSLPAWHTI